MEPSDLTIRVLTDIRDEIRGVKTSVDDLNQRVDGLGQRVDHLELRLATELTEVANTNRAILTLLRDRFDLRDRVERCEHDIADLKQRVDKPKA